MNKAKLRRSAVLRLFVLAILVSALASVAGATTYQVGPGRTYTKPQDVAGLLKPGDVVEVDGNATYPGDLQFTKPGTAANPITIRGIAVNGKKPLITGGTNTVHFRTDTIGQGADHYVMDGFEITGGSYRCVFHQSDDVTLRNLTVHGCPLHGILGADWGAGSLTVEYTEVYGSGSGDTYHQIYASTDEDNYPNAVFRLQHSWIHDATGGNNVKSRAARNEIYYNRIEGAYYHELELIGVGVLRGVRGARGLGRGREPVHQEGLERELLRGALRGRRHRAVVGPLPLREQHGGLGIELRCSGCSTGSGAWRRTTTSSTAAAAP